MKILHIITGLGNGGAENVLFRLVLADKENKHLVISLMDYGIYGEQLLVAGIPVYTIDMPRGRITLKKLLKLYSLIRAHSPDIVQTWMYHADFLGGIMARLAGCKVIVWGIRHSTLDNHGTNPKTRFLAKISARLSGLIPMGIACCSEAAIRYHVTLGYPDKKMRLIPNGYDLSKLKPNEGARTELRAHWNFVANEVVLGMVGRWCLQKDHANLIMALSYLKEMPLPVWRCVLVGPNMTYANQELVELIERYNVRDLVCLLGSRHDIPEVMNALDIHVLSSREEAFPNVLAEAMACGTPVVTTDVGDAALIVGATGWIVAHSDSKALAQAVYLSILSVAETSAFKARQLSARSRIEENFSIERMVNNYRNFWQECLNK